MIPTQEFEERAGPARMRATSRSVPPGSGSGVTLAALKRALDDEARLLAELIRIVYHQREGVATDDVQRVDDSVFSAHRLLRTSSEARQRRRALLQGLVGSEDISLDQLDDALGMRMNLELRQARDRLQANAMRLSREIAINKQIIQKALRSGDEHLRTLTGAPKQELSYGVDARSVEDSGQSGLLLNRQV